MRFDQILRWIILIGLFLIPFIPFIVVNGMYFPFITGKNFVFRILVEILFGTWLLLAFRNVLYRPSYSPLLVVLGAFLGVMTLATIFSENPFKSFWSNFERMEGLITLLHLGAYFLIAGTMLKTKQLWFALANTSVGASVVMGIYSLLQLAGVFVIFQGGIRIDGRFGNAAYLAIYMLFHIFITAVLIAKWRGHVFLYYIYGAILALQTFILFSTSTRGTILGLIGGSLLTFLLLLVFGKESPKLRKASLVLLLALFIAVSGFYFIRDASFVQESPIFSRLANISLDTGDSRFTIWGMALQGFQERPILGWGQESFNFIFNKYYHPSLFADEPWFDRAHNVFFDWLSAGGLLGLLSYLLFFFVTLFLLWRPKSHHIFPVAERALLTGLFAGYFFHNLFVFDNIVSYILFFSVLAYVYSRTRNEEGTGFFWRPHYGMVVRSVALVLITMATAVSVYVLNVNGIKTATGLLDTLRLPHNEQVQKLEEIASYNTLGSQEVAEQSMQIAVSALRSGNATLEVQQKLFTISERELKEELERTPNDARLHVFLGSLYSQFGQFDRALESIQRARVLSPDKQRIRYQEAFFYVDLKEYDKALEIFAETYTLDTRSDEAGAYYGAVALYAGDIELANSILEPLRVHFEEAGSILEYNFLLRAYSETGQFAPLLDVWDKRIEREPNNVQFRLSRVATLIQLNRNEEAILEIQRAALLDPQLQAQAGFFISEIRAGRGATLVQ